MALIKRKRQGEKATATAEKAERQRLAPIEQERVAFYEGWWARVGFIGGRYRRGVRPLLVFAAALAFGVLAGSTRAAHSPFTAIDLGTLGGPGSSAYAVSSSGEVVGVSGTASGTEHAFAWTADGGMVDLGSLGDRVLTADGVNAGGQVVGDSWTASLGLDAFSWTPQGGMVDIPDLGGGQNHAFAVNDAGQVLLAPGTGGGSVWTPGGRIPIVNPGGASFWPSAMNSSGQVVGGAYPTPTSRYYHAFSWTQAGGMVDIDPADAWSNAVGVADNGEVVGWEVSPTGQKSAFSWTPQGGKVVLPLDDALAVNESGQIVGTAGGRLVSWTPSGGLEELGTLGGGDAHVVNSNAYGDYRVLNESGQVVGYSTTASGETHAFSWTHAGGMVDLGTLGGVDSKAVALNDAGQIAGSSTTADGSTHAVLWEIDLTAPAAPSPPDLADASDSGISNSDNVTNKTSLTLSGTAEKSSTVRLYREATAVGTTTADPSSGAWAVTDSVDADGTYSYTATATDQSGNTSSVSAPLSVTVDTAAPAAPSVPDLLAASDSGVSNTDNLTNKTSPAFSGTAEKGSTVTLYRGPAAVGTGTADSSVGAWSVTEDVNADGVYGFKASATDPAGNTSPTSTSLTVTVDTTGPALNITGAADGASYTLPNLPTRPTFAPTDAMAGIADQHDSWATPGTSDGAGTYRYSASATDKAGNNSSETRTFTADDRTPPAAPTTPDLAAASDSGESNSDNLTNTMSLTFAGTAEKGSTITLYRGATAAASVVADLASGAWSAADTIATDGVFSYTATATDAAGNTSAASPALAVTVDTAAPALNISGAPDGSSFTLPLLPARPSFAPTDAGSGIADKNDSWTTPSSGGAGTFSYTATASDKAGNTATETRRYEVSAPTSASAAGAGGGGGGGGGSSSFTLAVTPQSQTVAYGSAASWTISITNTGGAYLYAVGLRDALAPSCVIPSSLAETAYFMAPGVTISYACSLASVTSSLTNTLVATATTGPGDVLTQTATAAVSVQTTPIPAAPPPRSSSAATSSHTINGTSSSDRLTGTARNDIINGRAGNDVLSGGKGNDTIFGGPGNDQLNGGPGKDKLYGGAGNDTILAADGRKDTVDCGPGRDIVTADKTDAVAKNCELVHRR